MSPGGWSGVEPPVPIPNTVVKRPSADDTLPAGVWENRPLPGSIFISSRLHFQPLGGNPRMKEVLSPLSLTASLCYSN